MDGWINFNGMLSHPALFYAERMDFVLPLYLHFCVVVSKYIFVHCRIEYE